MKRNTVLSILAAVVIILCGLLDKALLVLLIFPIGYFYFKHKEKKESIHTQPETIEDIISRYGNPDDSIIIDASRGNEIAGVILIYKGKGFLIADGNEIYFADIASVTAKNTATPYTFGQFQIIFTLRNPAGKYVRLDAGYDANYANGAVSEINKYL